MRKNKIKKRISFWMKFTGELTGYYYLNGQYRAPKEQIVLCRKAVKLSGSMTVDRQALESSKKCLFQNLI